MFYRGTARTISSTKCFKVKVQDVGLQHLYVTSVIFWKSNRTFSIILPANKVPPSSNKKSFFEVIWTFNSQSFICRKKMGGFNGGRRTVNDFEGKILSNSKFHSELYLGPCQSSMTAIFYEYRWILYHRCLRRIWIRLYVLLDILSGDFEKRPGGPMVKFTFSKVTGLRQIISIHFIKDQNIIAYQLS